jgi:GT2 family glycosyltransferase
MRASPLEPARDLPGPPVLGFLACGAVARRDAVLQSGGFHLRFGIGGEEELLALDLAANGWGVAYVDDVVAHHDPERGPRDSRTKVELRNRLWLAWLRRPLPRALRLTLRGLVRGGAAGALTAALRGLPWVLRERRVLPPRVEQAVRLLD